MNLADMLSYADIHQLGKIAVSYGCECNGHSKNELIQAILSAIGKRELIDSFVHKMSMEDIRFINSLLFESKSGYSMEELTARARQARFVQPGQETELSREMIVTYKHRGWLFNGYSQQTRYLFHVPDDIKTVIRRSLETRFVASLTYVDEPTAYRDEQWLIIDDIRHLLRYLATEDVLLTTDGTIYKRTLLSLFEGFAVKEEPLGRVGFRFGYGRKFREYPDRFSFIYDYCYYQHWIEEDEGKLILTELGQAKAESLNKDELGQIYRLWLRLYKGPIPNVLPLAYWLIRLSERWVTVASIIACLCPLVKPYYYDTPESVLERRMIHMLMHLGLLQIGEHPLHGAVIRATKTAAAVIKGISVSEEETIRLPEQPM